MGVITRSVPFGDQNIDCKVDLSFIPALETFTNDISGQMSQFTPIDSLYENQYSYRAIPLIASIAAAALSVMAFRASKWAAGALAALSVVCLYQGIDIESVKTKAYQEQEAAIKELFDPLISNLRKAYEIKYIEIRHHVDKYFKENKSITVEVVNQEIDKAVRIYDGLDTTTDYPKSPFEKGALANLTKYCTMLQNFNVELLPKDLYYGGPKQRVESLQKVANAFLVGERGSARAAKTSPYLNYAIMGRGATLVIYYPYG